MRLSERPEMEQIRSVHHLARKVSDKGRARTVSRLIHNLNILVESALFPALAWTSAWMTRSRLRFRMETLLLSFREDRC
jgi:hypothetical protein